MSEVKRERIVGVSISSSPNLADLGLGQEHLNEMMVSIARTVLRLGADDQPASLAYGGDLRPGGFLRILFPLARGEDPSLRDWNGRLYSVLAWPYYLDLPKSEEAELVNSCRFVRVTPADAYLEGVSAHVKPADPETPEAKYQVSRCLSRMREMMTSGEAFVKNGKTAHTLDARIIVGGQTEGYSGFMPGLLEEFLLAQQHQVPTYVIGAFGGIAGALAKALLGGIETDERFTLDGQLANDKNTAKKLPELIQEYQKHETDGVKQPAKYYDDLGDFLKKAKADVGKALRNGLAESENKSLMTTDRESEVIGLLEKGLRRILS